MALPLPRKPTALARRTARRLGCGFIMLPHGVFTLVDLAVVGELGGFTWGLNGKGYVRRKIWDGQKSHTVYLHREVMGAQKGDPEIDHRNRNTLDNRSRNLRRCADRVMQLGNAKKTTRYGSRSTSQYKGVTKPRGYKRWKVTVTVNYKPIPLGLFKTEIAAARAYDVFAVKRFGEFANLNGV